MLPPVRAFIAWRRDLLRPTLGARAQGRGRKRPTHTCHVGACGGAANELASTRRLRPRDRRPAPGLTLSSNRDPDRGAFYWTRFWGAQRRADHGGPHLRSAPAWSDARDDTIPLNAA